MEIIRPNLKKDCNTIYVKCQDQSKCCCLIFSTTLVTILLNDFFHDRTIKMKMIFFPFRLAIRLKRFVFDFICCFIMHSLYKIKNKNFIEILKQNKNVCLLHATSDKKIVVHIRDQLSNQVSNNVITL